MFDNGEFADRAEYLTIPAAPRGQGCIYIAQFSTGMIKVGHGTNPRGRVKQHAMMAEAHGSALTRCWVSNPHSGSWQSETDLINWCRANGQQAAGREYFSGIALEDAARFASSLVTLVRPVDRKSAEKSDRFFSEAKLLFMGQHPSQFESQRDDLAALKTTTDAEMRSFSHYRARMRWQERTGGRRALLAEEKTFLRQNRTMAVRGS